MNKNNNCVNCTKEFDAVLSYKRLLWKYHELSDVIIEYISETHLERSTRNANAIKLNEKLIRIVGGVKTSPGEFNECCIVGQKNENLTYDWFCSGVLINPRIVITAAHCYEPDPVKPYAVGMGLQDLATMGGGEIVGVRKAIPNPAYNPSINKINDIMILVLQTAARTQFASLATTDEISSSNAVKLVGFGSNAENAMGGFGTKRKVEVDILSIRNSIDEDLNDEEAKYGFESDLEFVAGGNGYDSCSGDSGGPAYVNVNGQWKVAGLTSRATYNSNKPCGDGGIYTRVDKHKSFIDSIINQV